MGLSKDQRAMLRLLAQREEGYDDIAALMGIGVDEVRARVREAVAELQNEDAGAGPIPSPPATPSASPTPATPSVSPVSTPAPPSPAGGGAGGAAREEASATAGGGGSPASTGPGSEGARRPASPPPVRRGPSPALRRLSLPKEPRRRLELVGAALLILLIALFATGAVDLGGGDSESEPTSGAAAKPDQGGQGGQGGIPAANPKFTQAVLEPVGGGDARGLAQFGKVKKSVVLQVEAEGLEPSGRGEAYTVWLYRSPRLVLRVGAVRVTRSGGIAAQFPIPTRLLGAVANRTFNQIDVSLTADSAYAAEVARAERQKRLPAHIGTSVLRGEITGPLVTGGR